MTNLERAEFTINAMFRTVISENGVDAKGAVTILNGLLVEWQKELLLQTFATIANEENTKQTNNVESEVDGDGKI